MGNLFAVHCFYLKERKEASILHMKNPTLNFPILIKLVEFDKNLIVRADDTPKTKLVITQ